MRCASVNLSRVRQGKMQMRPEESRAHRVFSAMGSKDSSGSRELSEALETVLLVEPFAQVGRQQCSAALSEVSALEDYIFDRPHDRWS